MSWKSFARAPRAVARHKLETGTLVVFAAVVSAGLFHDQPATPVSAVVETVSGEVVAALTPAVAEAPAAATSKLSLPNLEHPLVDRWIRRFTTSQRGSMATYLKRMERYEGMISQKLEQRDMPKDLIYLAMIESGFNPTARSPVKATGLWQFMSATAREFGLSVSGKVDERKNPARSTDAALKYLSRLHDRFGSWYLAAAAYNTGQGRVARIMKQVTGSTKGTDADYYRISSRLPQETRDYVPKLIAAARIGNDPARYGFSGN
jgi:membrane-bound lytic murein transglycosylase D